MPQYCLLETDGKARTGETGMSNGHAQSDCSDLDCGVCFPDYTPAQGDTVAYGSNEWVVTCVGPSTRGPLVQLKHRTRGHYADVLLPRSGAFPHGTFQLVL